MLLHLKSNLQAVKGPILRLLVFGLILGLVHLSIHLTGLTEHELCAVIVKKAVDPICLC
jgi:hypothetical protein